MSRRIAVLLPLALIVLSACGEPEPEMQPSIVWGGSPERGEAAIQKYGCYTCHTIPGIRGADAVVGPSLDRVAVRTYVAGHLPNTPENLISWIRDPQAHRQPTAMPDMDVTEQDARDIAAYLYTLK